MDDLHRFTAEELRSDVAAQMSPEQALALLRQRHETLQAIKEGLADVAAGRVKPLDEFLTDFETRHGIVRG